MGLGGDSAAAAVAARQSARQAQPALEGMVVQRRKRRPVRGELDVRFMFMCNARRQYPMCAAVHWVHVPSRASGSWLIGHCGCPPRNRLAVIGLHHRPSG